MRLRAVPNAVSLACVISVGAFHAPPAMASTPSCGAVAVTPTFTRDVDDEVNANHVSGTGYMTCAANTTYLQVKVSLQVHGFAAIWHNKDVVVGTAAEAKRADPPADAISLCVDTDDEWRTSVDSLGTNKDGSAPDQDNDESATLPTDDDCVTKDPDPV